MGIGINGGGQVIRLSGQVRSHMVINPVLLEAAVTQVGPEHGDHAQHEPREDRRRRHARQHRQHDRRLSIRRLRLRAVERLHSMIDRGRKDHQESNHDQDE